jgi:hypothetical protein
VPAEEIGLERHPGPEGMSPCLGLHVTLVGRTSPWSGMNVTFTRGKAPGRRIVRARQASGRPRIPWGPGAGELGAQASWTGPYSPPSSGGIGWLGSWHPMQVPSASSRAAARESGEHEAHWEVSDGVGPPSRGTYAMPSSRLCRSGTNHPHPCIIGCERHPRPSRVLVLRSWRSPPEGRRILGCRCVDADCPAFAEPRVTLSPAAVAGSMSAWSSLFVTGNDGTVPDSLSITVATAS